MAGGRPRLSISLARGASVNWIPAWEELTPLDAAERSNADELAGWLREHGARSAAELTP
jgi:hypothetical protein